MSPDDVIRLLAMARAAYPGMSMVEGMPQVWHGALGDLRLDECQAALITHTKASGQIVTVADLRRLVQSARTDAAMRAALPRGGSGVHPMPEDFWDRVNEAKAEAAPKWAAIRKRNGLPPGAPRLGDNYGGIK